jgi:hypothetical protein
VKWGGNQLSDPIPEQFDTAQAIQNLVRKAVSDGHYTPACGGYPLTVSLSVDTLTALGCVPTNLKYAEPTSDYSESNPGLHRLYVFWAQDHLKMIGEFLDRCAEYSNVNINIIAGAVAEQRAILLRTNAAYREACWRLQSGDLVLDPHPVNPHDKAIAVED